MRSHNTLLYDEKGKTTGKREHAFGMISRYSWNRRGKHTREIAIVISRHNYRCNVTARKRYLVPRARILTILTVL